MEINKSPRTCKCFSGHLEIIKQFYIVAQNDMLSATLLLVLLQAWTIHDFLDYQNYADLGVLTCLV